MDIVTDLFKTIARLQLRPDVQVERLSVVNPQPGRDGLPDELAALYDRVGAVSLRWHFTDAPELGGRLALRAPSSQGWWDATVDRPTTWPWVAPGSLLMSGAVGEEEIAIIEGADEGGVALRRGGELLAFDADGEAVPLDAGLDWLRAGIAQGFAHGWDEVRGGSFGKASAAVLERLATSVEPRTTVEAEVLEVAPLRGEAARHWLLGAMARHHFDGVMKALGRKEKHSRLEPAERGRVLAEALGDGSQLDAAARKKLARVFGDKPTVAAVRSRFHLDGAPDLDRVRLQLTLHDRAARSWHRGRVLLARILAAGPVTLPLDAERLRWVPGAFQEADLADLIPTVEAGRPKGRKAPTFEAELTMVADVAHELVPGARWGAPVVEPGRPLEG